MTSSLDSMVVGEPQILGQVKSAYESASQAGSMGTLLGRCFTRAFEVAKRVRTQTGIAEGTVSISSIACELAEKIFGSLHGRRIVLIGAGKMGESAAKTLRNTGGQLHVLNRSQEKAEALAEACGGRAVPFEAMLTEVGQADVVVASTASDRFILTHENMQAVVRSRKRRPLFIIDIAVPRDVDPRVSDLDNVFVYDIDDLQSVADDNLRERAKKPILLKRSSTKKFSASNHGANRSRSRRPSSRSASAFSRCIKN
ncbi:MAG: glutamyl-tRNA reductase [Polyangiales bacterium]